MYQTANSRVVIARIDKARRLSGILFFPTKKEVREAIAHFEDHVGYAIENFFAPQ